MRGSMRDLLKVFKAVADENRLRILKMLQKKKMCVCELAAILGIAQPSVSRHLSILKDAGLVEDQRSGQWVDYSICRDTFNQYASIIGVQLKQWINDDPKVKEDGRRLSVVSREELCKKG
jgi:ArsR family transcriptional regulator